MKKPELNLHGGQAGTGHCRNYALIVKFYKRMTRGFWSWSVLKQNSV
jgi:hypothetical protein